MKVVGKVGASHQVSNISNALSPTIQMTVQASRNTDTEAALAIRTSSEMDTLLENKMVEFAAKEQQSGGMLNGKRFV